MSAVVYPNIPVEDNEAKKSVFIEKPAEPTVVVNNYTIQKEEVAQPVSQPAMASQVVFEGAESVQAPSSADVEYYGKKIKITSWILIAVGAVSAACCIHGGFNARHIAEKVFHPHPHPHPHPHGEGRPRPPHPHPHPEHEQFLDRDEFVFYDVMKTMCFVGLVMSIAIACAGKKALWAVAMGTKKPNFSKKVFKKTLFRIGFIILCALYMHHQGKEAKAAIEHHKKLHPQPHPHPHPHNRTEMKKHHGRSLNSFEDFVIAGSDCHAVSDESSCDAIAACSWCKSAAVRSSCKTLDEAKSLPAAVFACDKVQDKEPVKSHKKHSKRGGHKKHHDFSAFYPKQVEGGDCHNLNDESSCDAIATCSWCRSAAVKSSCKTIDEAKALPSSIFACSHLTEEEPV